MEEETTIKDKLDEAVDAAWSAFMGKLVELGVRFDDCVGGIFVDDAEEKRTYCFNAVPTECDGYGGE